MRTWMTAVVVVVSLAPSVASAVLRINIERIDVVPSAHDQVVLVDVFLEDLDHSDERLHAFAVGIDAPFFSPDGVRFLPPVRPPGPSHPYVFEDFPGAAPQDLGSTYNRIRTGADSPGEADVSDTNGGLFGIPLLIPANFSFPLGHQPVFVLDLRATGFAGAGSPVVVVPGSGWTIIPEPTAAGTACVAAAMLLRRRRR